MATCFRYPGCACASPAMCGQLVKENPFKMNIARQLQLITFKPVNTPPEWARFVLQFKGGEYYYSDCEPEPMVKPRLANVYGAVCKPMPATPWPGRVTDWELVMPIPERNQPDIYHMIIEQNPERRTEHRKPVTSFDWELQQALIHLQNAISLTDSRRAHLLQSVVQIAKGVRESE